ncbi:hypothetical protein R3P38DRAFT_2805206 [Favolaschia claudopus]|uniref:Zn(2)-C6 fungal-type domain-containing protein n=1 Tax=Favolaschia claudopus TaxID=2862362 RepID=A0AAV9ZN49_9AGAR
MPDDGDDDSARGCRPARALAAALNKYFRLRTMEDGQTYYRQSEGTIDELDSDSDGEPEVSPPHKRSKKGNRDSEEPSPSKGRRKDKGKKKADESSPGPAEVRTTRGASQAHKDDPYEAEGFEPTTFDIRAAKEGLGILPKSFQASLLKGTSVLRLMGCGNCMIRNRKCRRENGHARCDACVKSGMSRCSDSFSIPEYLQVINFLEPLTVFSDRSWNSAFNELRDAHYSQILCDRQVTIANARLLRAHANLRALMNGSEVAFKGKVIPGIDSVAEEEGSEEEGEVVQVIAVEDAEAPREPSPMQEDAPAIRDPSLEPVAAEISLDAAIAADESGRDEFVQGSSGGGT